MKQKYPDLPVLLLLNVQSDIARIDKNSQEMQYFNNVFLWNGDPQIFLAMIKYVEDLQNAAHDTKLQKVRENFKGCIRVLA